MLGREEGNFRDKGNDENWTPVCEMTCVKWLLRLLPVLTFLWIFITMWICFGIAKENGHVGPWFPTISNAAKEVPERGIFSQLISVGIFFLVVNNFLRYFYLRGFGTWYKINVIGFVVGLIAAFGMSMVANFEGYYQQIPHIVGAFISIIMSMVYCWIETFLTFKVLLKYTYGKGIFTLQFVICIIMSALAIAFTVLGSNIYTKPQYEAADRQTWAIIEWILVAFELAFMLTYVPNYWRWKMAIAIAGQPEPHHRTSRIYPEEQRQEVCHTCEKKRKEISHLVLEDDIQRSTNEQHYTFDFARDVFIPHHSRQMGPLYFIKRRKVQIFGFRYDCISKQLNYLMDEDQTIGQDGKYTHGPNAVISMVDDALSRSSFREHSLKIHAFSCGGQNNKTKMRYMYLMGYFAWRVMVGLNREIVYINQAPGQGRCSVCDDGFVHLKRKYWTSDVDCLKQLADVVNESSRSNNAVLFEGDGGWDWRDWRTFISAHFYGILGIANYQHFRLLHRFISSPEPKCHWFDANERGVVFVKKSTDVPEVPVNILRNPDHTFADASRPDMKLPAGLSQTRKEYLFKTVRQYVRSRFRDITCPAPLHATG